MLPNIILLAVFFSFFGCTGLRQYSPPPEHHRSTSNDDLGKMEHTFQQVLDSAVNEHEMIGVQLSMKFPDGKMWSGVSGTTDLERRTLLTQDHVIRMGSLTKTYTAVVILRLMERGILDLDSSIHRWLPEFPLSPRITVRMLLNHSSGIPDLLGFRVMILSSLKSSKIWSTEELLEMIYDNDLDFEPGTDKRYSNSNYVLLGIIAERSTGISLRDLYQKEIFDPLSLHHTYFLPADGVPPELVNGYDRDLIPLPGWHTTTPENTSWSSCAHASGGMASTASEILTFYCAIMDHRIISQRSLQFMTQFSAAIKPRDIYLKEFGNGLFRYGGFYDNAVGHLGLYVGSESIAIFHPEKKFALVLLANVSRIKNGDAIVQKYLDIIRLRSSNK